MNQALLHLAWRVNSADPASVAGAKARLADGADRHLYTLRAWAVAKGQVNCLLVPHASLEQIAEAVWEDCQPVLSRWIEGRNACSSVAKQIEATGVDESRYTGPLAA